MSEQDETEPYFVLEFCEAAFQDAAAGLLKPDTAASMAGMVHASLAARVAALSESAPAPAPGADWRDAIGAFAPDASQPDAVAAIREGRATRPATQQFHEAHDPAECSKERNPDAGPPLGMTPEIAAATARIEALERAATGPATPEPEAFAERCVVSLADERDRTSEAYTKASEALRSSQHEVERTHAAIERAIRWSNHAGFCTDIDHCTCGYTELFEELVALLPESRRAALTGEQKP